MGIVSVNTLFVTQKGIFLNDYKICISFKCLDCVRFKVFFLIFKGSFFLWYLKVVFLWEYMCFFFHFTHRNIFVCICCGRCLCHFKKYFYMQALFLSYYLHLVVHVYLHALFIPGKIIIRSLFISSLNFIH